MYGDISYDRAINEIFAEDEKTDEDKAMALLLRQELKKTEDEKQD